MCITLLHVIARYSCTAQEHSVRLGYWAACSDCLCANCARHSAYWRRFRIVVHIPV